MHPFLHLPFIHHPIPAYGLLMLTGIFSTWMWLMYTAKSRKFSRLEATLATFLTANAAIIGGHVFYIIVIQTREFIQKPSVLFQIHSGGFVSYGGFIFGPLALFLYLKISKLPVSKYFDFYITSIPLIIFFERIGCILAGCCYGKPTTGLVHFTFTNPLAAAYHVYPNTPLIPFQLYDIIINGALLFAFLNWLYPRKQFDGQVFCLFFIIYAINRGLLEFLRGDDAARGIYFHSTISTAQITGLIFLCFFIPLYYFLKKSSSSSSFTMPIALEGAKRYLKYGSHTV